MKKVVYMMGLEPRYLAHVMQLWVDNDMACDIRLRRAKADYLRIVETDFKPFVDMVQKSVGCRVYVKEVNV